LQENRISLGAAKRASARSAAIVRGEMKRGLNSLATVASIAPWLGLFGTVLGIGNSFPGFDGSKESILAVIFERLSGAFVPCALGLMVAVVTMWFCKYLLSELESFDTEMGNASLQLINTLSRLQISN
jgi:biopolymer transport protein TolQ